MKTNQRTLGETTPAESDPRSLAQAAYLRHLREFVDFAQQGEFMIG
jgi:hypothetical protein